MAASNALSPSVTLPVWPSAQSASGTTSMAIDCRGYQALTFYITTSAGVSAGVVTVEESDDNGFTGTWGSITTVTTNAATSKYVVHLQAPGSYYFVRLRISTVLTGGTLTAIAIGN